MILTEYDRMVPPRPKSRQIALRRLDRAVRYETAQRSPETLRAAPCTAHEILDDPTKLEN